MWIRANINRFYYLYFFTYFISFFFFYLMNIFFFLNVNANWLNAVMMLDGGSQNIHLRPRSWSESHVTTYLSVRQHAFISDNSRLSYRMKMHVYSDFLMSNLRQILTQCRFLFVHRVNVYVISNSIFVSGFCVREIFFRLLQTAVILARSLLFVILPCWRKAYIVSCISAALTCIFTVAHILTFAWNNG